MEHKIPEQVIAGRHSVGGQCREVQGWHFTRLGSEKSDDAMWKVPGRGPIKPKLLPQKRTRESKPGSGHNRVGWSGKIHLPPFSGCRLHISDPDMSLCTIHVLFVTNELSTQAHFLLISQIREARLRDFRDVRYHPDWGTVYPLQLCENYQTKQRQKVNGFSLPWV